MRIAPFSERTQLILLSPIIVPVTAAAIVVFAPVVPFLWLWNRLESIHRKKWQERGRHSWFAWRPVKLSGFYFNRADRFVWLEIVERDKLHEGWAYRFPGELDRWESRANDAKAHPYV